MTDRLTRQPPVVAPPEYDAFRAWLEHPPPAVFVPGCAPAPPSQPASGIDATPYTQDEALARLRELSACARTICAAIALDLALATSRDGVECGAPSERETRERALIARLRHGGSALRSDATVAGAVLNGVYYLHIGVLTRAELFAAVELRLDRTDAGESADDDGERLALPPITLEETMPQSISELGALGEAQFPSPSALANTWRKFIERWWQRCRERLPIADVTTAIIET